MPGAIDVIRQVSQELGDSIVLGAGTVLDPETARAAILAGAEYIVAPTLNHEVIRLCRRYDKAVMPGALTPTEVLSAWESGADVVKVFPADVGGPAYLKALRGPLPQIRLMPTGGVDLTTAESFLKAGACCLGVGIRSGRAQSRLRRRLRPHSRSRHSVHRDRATIIEAEIRITSRSHHRTA